MRLAAVALLTLCQFSACPFLAIIAANTAREAGEARPMQRADIHNLTVINKTQL